jgi:hypothetical protein
VWKWKTSPLLTARDETTRSHIDLGRSEEGSEETRALTTESDFHQVTWQEICSRKPEPAMPVPLISNAWVGYGVGSEIQDKKKRGQLHQLTPCFCLVAGVGFEPTTFGL